MLCSHPEKVRALLARAFEHFHTQNLHGKLRLVLGASIQGDRNRLL